MSKNGKSSLTPKAKFAAMRNREKMHDKALSFGIYNNPKLIADLCYEAWAAGYFYAKQEKETMEVKEKSFWKFFVACLRTGNKELAKKVIKQNKLNLKQKEL